MSTLVSSTRLSRGAQATALLLKSAVIYAGIAFAGGTLINTGQTGAQQCGWTLQTVIMINPLIRWADANDHRELCDVLMTVADGLPREWLS